MFFDKIAEVEVAPLAAELEAQPELWGANQFRTANTDLFKGTGDIWCRYRARAELTTPRNYLEPHVPVFWPAWHALPALRPLVFDLCRQVGATFLGAVLITRIPPGGKILPHHDRGSWHAEFCDTKLYVGLKSNAQCINYCGDEQMVIRRGDAVVFDNLVTHSVENNGTTERVTLIICTRTL